MKIQLMQNERQIVGVFFGKNEILTKRRFKRPKLSQFSHFYNN